MDSQSRRPTYHRLETDEAGPIHELSTLRSSQNHGDGNEQPRATTLLSPNDEDKAEIEQAVKSRGRFTGWRLSAVTGAGLSTVALVLNVTALVWLENNHVVDQHSLVQIYRGDCRRVEQMQMWTHLAINVLSTALLGASNFCMQVLCAPLRSEVDLVHRNGKYLDIGVQSVRNLFYIAPWRTVMWLVLGLSSVPLHLLYNSAFYGSLSSQSYIVSFMTSDFATYKSEDGITAGDRVYNTTDTNQGMALHLEQLVEARANDTIIEQLDPLSCLTAYAQTITTGRSNVIVVTNNESVTTPRSTMLDYEHYRFSSVVAVARDEFQPYGWICKDSTKMYEHFGIDGRSPPACDVWTSRIKADIDNWTPSDYSVNHCLSERVEDHCSFNGNVQILKVVIAANAVKIVCMLVVAFGLGSHARLIIVGDAISSFLQKPDVLTRGCCFLSRADFATAKIGRPKASVFTSAATKMALQKGRQAQRLRLTWYNSASRTRWSIRECIECHSARMIEAANKWDTLGSILLAVIVVVVFFAMGNSAISQIRSASIASVGFGKLDPAALIVGWSIDSSLPPDQRIMYSSLIANIPQLVFSLLYVNLNSLATCMWLGNEWSDFETERKTLRVSDPRGKQRGTYFLQLPYRVGIPLAAVSGLLHWLISQSLFLAVVADYAWDGTLSEEASVAIATCGFSLLPMILVIVAGVVLCVGAVLLGRRKLGADAAFMPLAGSCSFAIAAACHAPADQDSTHLEAILWGAIPPDEVGLIANSGRSEFACDMGHCSFTSAEVDEVKEGRIYA